MSETVHFEGLSCPYREIQARYDYAADKTLCPHCGGRGVPYAGWFTCLQSCGCIALVEDGTAFMPEENSDE